MKKKILFELYAIIKEAKISTLSDASAIAIIKACRAIRPLFADYQEAEQDARERFKEEEFDCLIEKYSKKTLTQEEEFELVSLNKRYTEKLNEFTQTLLNEETGLELGKLSPDDFKAFRKANDIAADKLAVLYEFMC